VDLGVTVLTSLGGRHVNNLTGTALDDNMTVLTESRTLHGEGKGSAGRGGLKVMLKKIWVRKYSNQEATLSSL